MYYVRAYTINNLGTTYGQQVTFKTNPENTVIDHPYIGRVWMDRNLGAQRVATTSTDPLGLGDLYQWGRAEDGHQKRNSAITVTLSGSDQPTSGNFITVNSGVKDWRNPQNANLWQGLNGVNNPCPSGFRLPTEAEWATYIAMWGINNIEAFTTPLKLTKAGTRTNTGTVSLLATNGYYWTSTVDGTKSRAIVINGNQAVAVSQERVQGNSVRCIMN